MEFSDDIYYLYGIGLYKLLELIGKKNKYYYDALVFQQRLVENISQTKRYGDTDTRKAERAEIISNLNMLSLKVLGVSFNELCEFTSAAFFTGTQSGSGSMSQTSSLPESAWTNLVKISKTYDKNIKTVSLLLGNGEYEEAEDLYWKTLYYSGYRELWEQRSLLSNQILKLSLKEKDYKTSGLILSKGIAYALMSQKKYPQAQFVLEKAHECFKQANAYAEDGIYYDYMGDIYEETGQLDKAFNYYKEAEKRFTELNEYKIYLKQLFIKAKHDNLESKSRVVALTLLRDQFSLIKNYREGLAEVELAKSLYTLDDKDEAIKRAQKGYYLLNDVIMMPRNAEKAEKVLKTILDGNPIIEK